MTIYERAVDLVADGATVGLGSGRAAMAFVSQLGERVRAGKLHVRGLPTSTATAELARQEGIPLVTPADVPVLDLTIDGADEVDPHLDLIKGYGRSLVRERIVAAMSKRFVILVGEEKIVPRLGSRRKLPVEVVPFALALCERRLRDLQYPPTAFRHNGDLFVSDNGNNILDCAIGDLDDPAATERDILAIPGVIDTGLFLDMADLVLIGDRNDFGFIEERKRR
jgi:ribose 5-phosphate isomerase A